MRASQYDRYLQSQLESYRELTVPRPAGPIVMSSASCLLPSTLPPKRRGRRSTVESEEDISLQEDEEEQELENVIIVPQ